MALVLRQSTAVDVLIGPFVDDSDGATAEEAVSPSVLLSKNGQTLAAKNDATTPTHDDAGYYNCELDATDTNTVGTLVLIVEADGTALPVRHEYQVVEESTYDYLFASGSAPDSQMSAILTDTEASQVSEAATLVDTEAIVTDTEAILVDSEAILADTSQMTFTVAGQVDANIQYVNDVAVAGTGASGDEWGPA